MIRLASVCYCLKRIFKKLARKFARQKMGEAVRKSHRNGGKFSKFQPRAALVICAVGSVLFLIPGFLYWYILYRPPIYDLQIEQFAGAHVQQVRIMFGGKVGLYFLPPMLLLPVLFTAIVALIFYFTSFCCFSRLAAVVATVFTVISGVGGMVMSGFFMHAAMHWYRYFASEAAITYLHKALASNESLTTQINDIQEWLYDFPMAYGIAAISCLLHGVVSIAIIAPVATCFIRQKVCMSEHHNLDEILPLTNSKDSRMTNHLDYGYSQSVRERVSIRTQLAPPMMANHNKINNMSHGHSNSNSNSTTQTMTVDNSTSTGSMSPREQQAKKSAHRMGARIPKDRTYYGVPAHRRPAALAGAAGQEECMSNRSQSAPYDRLPNVPGHMVNFSNRDHVVDAVGRTPYPYDQYARWAAFRNRLSGKQPSMRSPPRRGGGPDEICVDAAGKDPRRRGSQSVPSSGLGSSNGRRLKRQSTNLVLAAMYDPTMQALRDQQQEEQMRLLANGGHPPVEFRRKRLLRSKTPDGLPILCGQPVNLGFTARPPSPGSAVRNQLESLRNLQLSEDDDEGSTMCPPRTYHGSADKK